MEEDDEVALVDDGVVVVAGGGAAATRPSPLACDHASVPARPLKPRTARIACSRELPKPYVAPLYVVPLVVCMKDDTSPKSMFKCRLI